MRELSAGRDIQLVWRNQLGGLTFRDGEVFIKWNPSDNGIDLERERIRLEWLADRHPAPRVLDYGADDTGLWLVKTRLPGEAAIGDKWRARPGQAIAAIATGLRALHAIPIDEFPKA